jgi:hypothetical protein
MKSKVLVLAATLTSVGAAYAQDVQNARQAMQTACATDTASLCAGKAGMEAGQCLRDAGDKVSPICRDALAKMGGPGGPGGPGAPGGPGGPGARRGPGGPGAPGAAGPLPPRAPPSEGGTVGMVASVSATGFEITLPSGAKATIATSPSTTYRMGAGSATATAVKAGQPVLAIGIVQDLQGMRQTTVQASQVIVAPPGIAVAAPPPGSNGDLPRGQPAEKKSVGNPPADYVEGEGTIVGPAEADRAIVAALTAYPNGVINRVVKVNPTTYEAHHIGVAWPHHIFVSTDFKYLGAS